MSEGLAAVIIICLTLIGIVLVISTTKLILAKESRPAELSRDEAERMRERIERAPKPTPGIPWEERDPDRPTPQNDGLPLPVDPGRPPTVKIYRPRPGSTEPSPRCVCHQLPVEPGDKVLWWPMPGSEEVRMFCQRGEDG